MSAGSPGPAADSSFWAADPGRVLFVLARDVVLHHIEPRHWSGWFALLIAPALSERPRWALAIVEESKVLRLLVAGHGARHVADPAALALPPTPAHLQA